MIFKNKNLLTPSRTQEYPLKFLKGHGGDEALPNKMGNFFLLEIVEYSLKCQ